MKFEIINLTKCFCVYTDDECFYVGLGHQGGASAKKGGYVPNEYRPFQCCPTKLERSTKVPKMTAQKIGHAKTNTKDDGGNFKFSAPKPTTTKPKSPIPVQPKANNKPEASPIKFAQVRKVNGGAPNRKDDKKAIARNSKDKVKGQKGMFGMGKYIWW